MAQHRRWAAASDEDLGHLGSQAGRDDQGDRVDIQVQVERYLALWFMSTPGDDTVGLRELRHHTSEVLARVRHGETIDVTDYGTLIARIIPVEDRTPSPALERLIESGRVRLATRPGYRPRMCPGDGTDRLGDALTALRDEESW